jgi:uncharacterized protein
MSLGREGTVGAVADGRPTVGTDASGAKMRWRRRTPAVRPQGMEFKTLGAYVAIAFGLAWGLMGLKFAFPEPMEALFGPMGYTNPAFILAVYAPGFAGLFLVWRYYGLSGLGRYLKRLTMWRMPLRWWALLVLGIPAAFYIGAAITGSIGDPFPFTPWYAVLPAMLAMLLIGPMEEFGWRGVALPLLQRRFAPVYADLILAAIWSLWHLPAFFLDGTPQNAWSFGPYLIGMLAVSMILCAMFNASGGSILVAALFHFQLNNPIWPDAHPWDSAVFVVIAILVLVVNRKAMFSREGAATEIVPPAERSVTR